MAYVTTRLNQTGAVSSDPGYPRVRLSYFLDDAAKFRFKAVAPGRYQLHLVEDAPSPSDKVLALFEEGEVMSRRWLSVLEYSEAVSKRYWYSNFTINENNQLGTELPGAWSGFSNVHLYNGKISLNSRYSVADDV